MIVNNSYYMIARKSGDLETGDRDRAMIAAALVKSPLTLNAVDRASIALVLQNFYKNVRGAIT